MVALANSIPRSRRSDPLPHPRRGERLLRHHCVKRRQRIVHRGPDRGGGAHRAGLADAAGSECGGAGRRLDVGDVDLRHLAQSESEAKEKSDAVTERLTAMLSKDPRAVIKVSGSASKPVPDDAKLSGGGGFVMSANELIVSTPDQIAEQIISQCRAVGAGHFLAVLH